MGPAPMIEEVALVRAGVTSAILPNSSVDAQPNRRGGTSAKLERVLVYPTRRSSPGTRLLGLEAVDQPAVVGVHHR